MSHLIFGDDSESDCKYQSEKSQCCRYRRTLSWNLVKVCGKLTCLCLLVFLVSGNGLFGGTFYVFLELLRYQRALSETCLTGEVTESTPTVTLKPRRDFEERGCIAQVQIKRWKRILTGTIQLDEHVPHFKFSPLCTHNVYDVILKSNFQANFRANLTWSTKLYLYPAENWHESPGIFFYVVIVNWSEQTVIWKQFSLRAQCFWK